jgi:TRAP-type C4-dicarboxylate transport system substrate-binding protein
MAAEVGEKSEEQVRFKIYPGGISGDELDVLRKMRVNRIQAAGLSGVGLGIILPKIRILEAPLLYKDNIELDRVKEELFPEFAADFEERGFVLLGFAEAGAVYFFSKQDLSAPGALKRAKMWAWKGDPVAQVFLETFGIKTYPLHLADVSTGLETGMIDAFYSPPLAAIAFQWHTKISYLLDYPMANSTGALVIRKQAFDRLSPENQALLKTAAAKYCRQLVDISRRENADAIRVMKEAGIRMTSPGEEQVRSFAASAEETYRKNIPGLYSEELLSRVKTILNAQRSGQ